MKLGSAIKVLSKCLCTVTFCAYLGPNYRCELGCVKRFSLSNPSRARNVVIGQIDQMKGWMSPFNQSIWHETVSCKKKIWHMNQVCNYLIGGNLLHCRFYFFYAFEGVLKRRKDSCAIFLVHRKFVIAYKNEKFHCHLRFL